jgi:hypothetical protein
MIAMMSPRSRSTASMRVALKVAVARASCAATVLTGPRSRMTADADWVFNAVFMSGAILRHRDEKLTDEEGEL